MPGRTTSQGEAVSAFWPVVTVLIGLAGGWLIGRAWFPDDANNRPLRGEYRATKRVDPKVIRAPLSPSGLTRPRLVVVHRVDDMRKLVLDERLVARDLRRVVDKVKRESAR